MSPDVALALEDVGVTLDGRAVLAHVNVRFLAGRTAAVVGRSGAGKSVLMKAAAGLLPHSGRAVVGRAPLAFVHQDPALLDDLDVEENVAFALSRRAHTTPSDRGARVNRALTLLELLPHRGAPPSQLPLAVQKRVALARALALGPGILVVDEPTTGLDPRAAALVDASLRAVAEARSTTLVVITHSPRTLAALDPDIVVVRDGTAFAHPAQEAA
jgi:tungstate transport system ATP-binding protein